eukprot:scaffold148651_cov31-Tisochrysis_lutea.AAC.7
MHLACPAAVPSPARAALTPRSTPTHTPSATIPPLAITANPTTRCHLSCLYMTPANSGIPVCRRRGEFATWENAGGLSKRARDFLVPSASGAVCLGLEGACARF